MFGIPVIEWLGYIASVLIAISMFMKDVVKLRFINLIGSLCFVIYGMIIKAYPVALTNLIIVGVNLFYIYKITKDRNIKENANLSKRKKK